MIEQPPPANRAALGIALFKARSAAGLTLDGLAERSGISRRMLIEMEQGRVNPSVHVLHAVVHATNVPILTLWQAVCEGHEPAGR